MTGPLTVMFRPRAMDVIEREASASGPNETGGLLLGYRRTDIGVIVVEAATGPGRCHSATPTSLQLDTSDLQRTVQEEWDRSDGDVTYLGDWHLHHESCPKPSWRDRVTVAGIGHARRVRVPQPLLVIVGDSDERAVRAWVGRLLAPAEVVIVPESPSGQ